MFRHKSYSAIVRFFLTLAFIDRLLEVMFKHFLHNKRDIYLRKYSATFSRNYPDLPIGDLQEKLNDEADRVYDIVDRSILRERIIRAKYIFWLSGISAVVVVGSVGGFSSGSFVPFISPLAAAVIGWSGSLLTIPISYNQRVKGSLDSVLTKHRKAQTRNFSTRQIASVLSPDAAISSNLNTTRSNAPYEPLHEVRIEIPVTSNVAVSYDDNIRKTGPTAAALFTTI